jgi:hypothetical protein
MVGGEDRAEMGGDEAGAEIDRIVTTIFLNKDNALNLTLLLPLFIS